MLQLASDQIMRDIGLPVPERKDGQVEEWTEGGPAVRRYHSGQNIVYGILVINPKVNGPDRMPRAFVQLRLYRNGKLFYTGKEEHAMHRLPDDPAEYAHGGVLRLGNTLIPAST